MPVRRVRYRMNNKSFGAMMMSEQTLSFAKAAAEEIARVATDAQRLSTQPYEVDTAVPPVVLDGNPRVVAHVVGKDPLHAVEEWGSGTKSEGATAGQPRPQGGYSEGRRTLARAGARVVPFTPRGKKP